MNKRIDIIQSELEAKRLQKLKDAQKRQELREEYLKNNPHLFVHCKKCGVDRHISEYTLIFRLNANRFRKKPELQCKFCARQRDLQRRLDYLKEVQ